MLKTKGLNILFAVGKWALTVCFALFLVIAVAHDYNEAKLKKIKSFMFMPNTHKYLVDVIISGKDFDKTRLRKFGAYFNMLVRQEPERADAYGMLGFFSYHLGKLNQAVSSYKKALDLNPDFFWYHYNLGVIYFRKGDYKSAVESLEAAIKTSPKESLLFILDSSSFYIPVMVEYLNRLNYDTYAKWLGSGYKDSNELLILSHYYLKDYSKMFGIASYARNSFPQEREIFDYYRLLALYKLKGESGAMSVSDDWLNRRKQAVRMAVF